MWLGDDAFSAYEPANCANEFRRIQPMNFIELQGRHTRQSALGWTRTSNLLIRSEIGSSVMRMGHIAGRIRANAAESDAR